MTGNTKPRHSLRLASSEEALAEHLARRIFEGELAPGEPMREQQLVDEYGVGRYTVRAALKRLANDGLVTHQPNHSASVVQFDIADVQEIYWLRQMLEEGVARWLAENRIRPVEAERELLRFQSLLPDAPWRSVVEVDMALHAALISAAGSPRLDRLYRSLSTEMQFGIMQLRSLYPSPSALAVEHKELLDAVGSGNGEMAAAAIREHLTRASDAITVERVPQTTLAVVNPLGAVGRLNTINNPSAPHPDDLG